MCALRVPHDTLTPTSQVVSAKFTGYDDWVGPSRFGVCRDYAWALRTKDLRLYPLLVRHTRPSVTQATRTELAALLAGPLPVEVAVTVPLRPGRKRLLPSARWGHVTTDNTTMRWGQGDAARLQAMQRLRRSGFGGRMLTGPAPAWQVLRERGLDTTKPILAVLDGAKALSEVVCEGFDHPVIGRCQFHMLRNVRDPPPGQGCAGPGQIPWPPPGTSRDRHRAGLTTATGQKPMSLDTRHRRSPRAVPRPLRPRPGASPHCVGGVGHSARHGGQTTSGPW